jgi:phosphatidylglycerophosphatase A
MHDDPAEIVIDEVVGCMITFFMVPLTMQWAMLGLVLFRFFDIFKIGGIRRLERFVSAWGVMLDDIAAGIVSNVIIQLVRYYAQ